MLLLLAALVFTCWIAIILLVDPDGSGAPSQGMISTERAAMPGAGGMDDRGADPHRHRMRTAALSSQP